MELSFKTYKDKVCGCFSGKNIGGTLGAPFEGFRGVYDITHFMQDVSRPVPNDDLDLQLVWLRAAELYGRNLNSHILTEFWNTYISATICEYGIGKNNFNSGIYPPLSGYLSNRFRHSNGAWIRTEIWACLCAGNPALAANYAYYDSSVDHCGEGVNAAVFTAALQAAAFFESDIFKLVDIALTYVPEDSDIRKAIDCVFDAYKAKKTWKEARKLLFKVTPCSFGQTWRWEGTKDIPVSDICPEYIPDPEIPKTEQGYDAPWSIGAILIGLLWGNGDFGKSICITVNLGEDTDCTAGTVGSILGIIQGADKIPDEWKNACSNEISTCTLRIDNGLKIPKTIEQLVERVVRLTPEILRQWCAFREGEEGYVITATEPLSYNEDLYFWGDQENAKELLGEQGKKVRWSFPTVDVTVEYDDTLIQVKSGHTKKFTFNFITKLWTIQYFTIRVLGLPEGWSTNYGNEFSVILGDFRSEKQLQLELTSGEIKQGAYTIVFELSSRGRGSKYYIPVTLLNGV